MKKCKNEPCNNHVADNRIYCSQSCRSKWTNKHLKDYSNVSKTLLNNTLEKEIEYNKSPKLCKNCNNIISYKNKRKIFCNHSCSATYSNRNRNVKRYIMSDAGKKNLQKSAYKNFHNYTYELKQKCIEIYNKEYKICSICNKKIPYEKRKYKFCSKKCFSIYRKGISKLSEYQYYKSLCKFKFNVFNYPDEFDLNLIKKYGIYKAINNGNNLNGISRDHKISITDGFRKGILPYYISHPANCELMVHTKNISKNKKSSISLKTLIENIKFWKNKYGGVV